MCVCVCIGEGRVLVLISPRHMHSLHSAPPTASAPPPLPSLTPDVSVLPWKEGLANSQLAGGVSVQPLVPIELKKKKRTMAVLETEDKIECKA